MICKISLNSVRAWILKYNSHEERKTYRTGGTVIMTKGLEILFEKIKISRFIC